MGNTFRFNKLSIENLSSRRFSLVQEIQRRIESGKGEEDPETQRLMQQRKDVEAELKRRGAWISEQKGV